MGYPPSGCVVKVDLETTAGLINTQSPPVKANNLEHQGSEIYMNIHICKNMRGLEIGCMVYVRLMVTSVPLTAHLRRNQTLDYRVHKFIQYPKSEFG